MKPELRLALIQCDLHWEDPVANRATIEEGIWRLKSKADLILLPEMFTTGFTMNPEPVAELPGMDTFKWMRLMATQTGAVILGSYIIKEGGAFYNRLYAVYPNGESQHYDKRHLFGLAGEDGSYTSGHSRLILEVGGWRIMPLICYDLRFPVWSRQQCAYEYDLLVYIANWPEQRTHAWDTLLSARAIENQCYCAGVNRTGKDGVGTSYVGHSAIYNPLGKALNTDESNFYEVVLSKPDLDSYRDKFPFQKDADKFKL